MSNNMINKNLIVKITSFLKKNKNFKYLNPIIFEKIDEQKKIDDTPFDEYFIEYMSKLPKLDFKTTIKLSREVYQLYGKENEFDKILNRFLSNYSIDNGSLNKDDNNFIAKATENKILLSGTYYDVILICHEIGHKLKGVNNMSGCDVMDEFFFETTSIIFELSANDYLRDNYGIDIAADELRNKHISSIQKEDNIDSNVFSIVVKLLKEKKLNAINLYIEFINNLNIVKYLDQSGSSIETCVKEGMSDYSYAIGYMLGNYIKNCNNRNEMLNIILNRKDSTLNIPLYINEMIINEVLGSKKNAK